MHPLCISHEKELRKRNGDIKNKFPCCLFLIKILFYRCALNHIKEKAN
jgi:hypothetical protein